VDDDERCSDGVVNSIVFILVLDYVITRMLLPFTQHSMAGGF
jgi:hypothetical protein